jgi:hypothetical protein
MFRKLPTLRRLAIATLVLLQTAALVACGGEQSLNDDQLEYEEALFAARSGSVTGVIDGLRAIRGKQHVLGWACVKAHNASISVHLYVGGQAGKGSYARSGWANSQTEPAVNAVCGTAGATKHRFAIPIDDLGARYEGQTIWIHGIHPARRGSNRLLHASGKYKVPGPTTAGPSGPKSISHNPGMTKRRIKSRLVPDTNYQYRNCPDGCAGSTPSYLFHVVAEDGADWYSAISGHPHAQSPAYASAHVHRGIPGVHGVAVNHYWVGSGADTEAYLATNAFPKTIGARKTNHYLFNGMFETSAFGGPKPVLTKLWQHFKVRLKQRTGGGRPDDDYRVLTGISWTDVAGRRYIVEINLASSDESAGMCLNRLVCAAGTHHNSMERYITMGSNALELPRLNGSAWTRYAINWGAVIKGLKRMTCNIDGGSSAPCIPSYALHYDGRNPKCTFNAGVSSETRGIGYTEIGVADLDLRQ